MTRKVKIATQLSQILPNCSEQTEEINRSIINIIAKLFNRYPRDVDVSGIIEAMPHKDPSTKLFKMLVRHGMLSGTTHQMNLTLTGYAAVNNAVRAEPQLAAALREDDSPECSCDYSTLMLSILREYSKRHRRE